MKKRNQRRDKGQDKIQALVESIGYRQRLRDLLTTRRMLPLLKKLGLIVALTSIAAYAVHHAYVVMFQKAQEMRIERVDFQSFGIIDQSAALEMMGLSLSSRLSSISAPELEKKLQQQAIIADANVYVEYPHTLHIRVEERLPVLYVKRGNDLTGPSYFMDQHGVVFPVDKRFHQEFLNSPVWYIDDQDCESFTVGSMIKESSYKPIIQLVAAINAYELVDIPRVKDIYRPKEWKIIFSLDSGCQVMMKSFDIEDQTNLLYEIIKHSKATKRQLRSVNVIPHRNPAVTFF